MASSAPNELQWEYYEGPEHDRQRSRKRQVPEPNQSQHRCDFCNRSFNRPSALAKHVLSHTGERPHACTFCGMRFVTTSNMFRHMRGCPDKPNDVLIDEQFIASVQSSSSQSSIRFTSVLPSQQRNFRSRSPTRVVLDCSRPVNGNVWTEQPSFILTETESFKDGAVSSHTLDLQADAHDGTTAQSTSSVFKASNYIFTLEGSLNSREATLELYTQGSIQVEEGQSTAATSRDYLTPQDGMSQEEHSTKHETDFLNQWEDTDSQSSMTGTDREAYEGNAGAEKTVIIDPRLRKLSGQPSRNSERKVDGVSDE